jgi:putative OPT family oligopeptide transporter
LLTPIIYYFISPYINAEFLNSWAQLLTQRELGLSMEAAAERVKEPAFQITQVWYYIVKPIAIGGMLMGVLATLFKMRKSLVTGLGRSISDVKKAAAGQKVEIPRTEKDLKFPIIVGGILAGGVVAFCITKFVFNTGILPALVAAFILIFLGFFFAAISGYLVGIIGSSNNPLSGLTLTALVVTALILVIIGVKGDAGVSTVLGVAAFLCVAAAVAGEMFQDLKVGHILGGTPWKMQAGNIISVVISALVMFIVLNMLNQADIAQGQMEGYTGGFGSKNLSAPQAGLMAILSKGIVSGDMSWALIIVGLFMGVAFIMMQVKSPMLVSVGMYLPLETTFAIFIGGMIKGAVNIICKKRKYTKPQLARVENIGILIASGLVAGEAITNLGFAPFKIAKVEFPKIFEDPPLLIGFAVLAFIVFVLIQFPLKNAGKPEENS